MNFPKILICIFILQITLINIASSQKDTVNPNGYNVFHYPNGFKLSEGYMNNGKPDGYWTTYYVNGKKKSEGNRKNFIIDSLWIFYAENGDTTESIYYAQGKKNGFHCKYYTRLDSGVNIVKSRELYVDDQKQGFSFYYFPNGKVQYKIKYKDNIKTGSAYEFDESGTLAALLEYRNDYLVSRKAVNRTDNSGQRTGTWVDIYDNGQLKTELNYVNGLPNGRLKEFSPSGAIIKMETYNNGLMVSEINKTKYDSLEVKEVEIRQEYYPNGKIKSVRTYKDSIPTGTHIYYNENGTIKKAEIYNEFGIVSAEGLIDTLSRKQGLWTFYYDENQKSAVGSYADNKRAGEWTFYYESGSIRQTGNFADDFPDGVWTWFYENGALLRKETYFTGVLEGPAFELSPDGDTITKGKYLENQFHGEWYFKIGDEYTFGKFYYGLKTGEWKIYYYPEMVLKTTCSYSEDKLTGKSKTYYKNKKIKEFGEYSNNYKTGKWSYYREDGTLDFTAEYLKGTVVKVNDMKIE